jgi:hypothetical protein
MNMGTGLSVHCCENCNLPERCRCDVRRFVCCGGDSESEAEPPDRRRQRPHRRRRPSSGAPDDDGQLIMLKNPGLKLTSIVPRSLNRCGYFIFDAVRDRLIAAEGDGPSSLGLEASEIVNRKAKDLPPRAQDIVSICRRTLQGAGEFLQIQLLYKSNVVLASTFPVADNLGALLAVLLVTRPMPQKRGIDLDRFVVGAPHGEFENSDSEELSMEPKARSGADDLPPDLAAVIAGQKTAAVVIRPTRISGSTKVQFESHV